MKDALKKLRRLVIWYETHIKTITPEAKAANVSLSQDPETIELTNQLFTQLRVALGDIAEGGDARQPLADLEIIFRDLEKRTRLCVGNGWVATLRQTAEYCRRRCISDDAHGSYQNLAKQLAEADECLCDWNAKPTPRNWSSFMKSCNDVRSCASELLLKLPLRQLMGILHADAKDFTERMTADEVRTARYLSGDEERIRSIIEQHSGQFAGGAGDDSLLGYFSSGSRAIDAAIAIQETYDGLSDGSRLQFRIGIHVGEVDSDGRSWSGAAINLAARIQSVAPPGGIYLSKEARTLSQVPKGWEPRPVAPQQFKGVPEITEVFVLELSDRPVSQATQAESVTAAVRRPRTRRSRNGNENAEA